jgi:hypothetical protein
MTAGLIRILACLLLFGLGAEALGGAAVGVILCAHRHFHQRLLA